MKNALKKRIRSNDAEKFQGNDFHSGDASDIIGLLSDDLYEKPFASTIREIYSNVMDVHQSCNELDSNGNLRPGYVQLPSVEKSQLTIRDFGTGLDRNTFPKLITSVAVSTKKNSNFQLGTYGIGSLSPLSMTSAYVVHSVYRDKSGNMLKDTYDIFKDASSKPQYQLQNEKPIKLQEGEDHTGITYEIPAPHKYSNIDDAFQVLKHFSPAPFGLPLKFYDMLSDFHSEPVYQSKDGKFKIGRATKDMRIHSDTGSFIELVMGGVSFRPKELKLKHTPAYWDLMVNVVLHVPIGLFNPTPSRENIKYDDAGITLSKISEYVEKYISEMVDDVTKEAQSKETKFECWKYLRSIVDSFGTLRKYMNGGTIQYDGEPLNFINSYMTLEYLDDNGVKKYEYVKHDTILYENDLTLGTKYIKERKEAAGISGDNSPHIYISHQNDRSVIDKILSQYAIPVRKIEDVEIDIESIRAENKAKRSGITGNSNAQIKEMKFYFTESQKYITNHKILPLKNVFNGDNTPVAKTTFKNGTKKKQVDAILYLTTKSGIPTDTNDLTKLKLLYELGYDGAVYSISISNCKSWLKKKYKSVPEQYEEIINHFGKLEYEFIQVDRPDECDECRILRKIENTTDQVKNYLKYPILENYHYNQFDYDDLKSNMKLKKKKYNLWEIYEKISKKNKLLRVLLERNRINSETIEILHKEKLI